MNNHWRVHWEYEQQCLIEQVRNPGLDLEQCKKDHHKASFPSMQYARNWDNQLKALAMNIGRLQFNLLGIKKYCNRLLQTNLTLYTEKIYNMIDASFLDSCISKCRNSIEQIMTNLSGYYYDIVPGKEAKTDTNTDAKTGTST